MLSTESAAFTGKRRRSARLAAAEPRRDKHGDDQARLAEETRQPPPEAVAAAKAAVPRLQPPTDDQLCEPSQGPTRELEHKLGGKGFHRVAGIDEAGRGPLAGPVVAAACHIPLDLTIQGVKDSKKLSAKRREEVFESLINDPRISFSTCVVEPDVIDQVNILQATLLAMHRAAAQLQPPPDFHLVDGLHVPKGANTRTWQAVVGGDDCCCAIAAASIIAKVTRDRLMEQYNEQYPQYGFGEHKGYGTKKHMAALKQHGPCPIHRRSFEPVKSGVFR